MIAILSPAKTLNFQTPAPYLGTSAPIFSKEADYLANKLSKLSNAELASLLDISPKLAQLNTERYAIWKNAPEKQAIFAFDGDVYDGLNASQFTLEQIEFSQKHLRILSGIYGFLKPLDLIKPHRLEMGTQFKTLKADSLYDYWSKKVTLQLSKELKANTHPVLINLASQEYYSVLKMDERKIKAITPIFKESKNNTYSIVSFFAKKARGMMCRYMIENQITDYEMLIGFDEKGYNFNHGLSTSTQWVFTRG